MSTSPFPTLPSSIQPLPITRVAALTCVAAPADLAITLAGYGSTLAQIGQKELASKVTMQAVNLTRGMFIRAINTEMLNMVLEPGRPWRPWETTSRSVQLSALC